MQNLPDLSQLSHAQKDELIVFLWTQVQELTKQLGVMGARVQMLEHRLSLNSRNSSQPPSSDGLRKPAPKSLRQTGQHPNGGQKGHPGNTLRQSQHIDVVIEHKASPRCAVCHGQLQEHEILERRQVFELPPLQMQVIEHRLLGGRCACGAWHEGAWPAGLNAPAQYGASVKAMAVSLSQQHLIPLARVCEVMQDAFGLDLSQASVLQFNRQAAQALVGTVASIGQAVQSAPVVHADESGIRVKGQLHWLHCLVTQNLTWLGQHAKRGTVAFDELGLLTGVRGTLVHDGLASYKELDCTHSLCNAHHLRELVLAHEQDKPFDGWAQEMMDLLLLANTEVRQRAAALPQERQLWYATQWDALLARAQTFNPEDKDYLQHAPMRGRRKQSTTFNLIRRLRLHRDDVWRFMTQAGVPFTNNLAEQAIRMCKVKQKISGCFRTLDGANTFFTNRAYLATMKKQKANLLHCLHSVFSGQPLQPQFS